MLNLLKDANRLFDDENYKEALDIYRKASVKYGDEYLDFNIEICKKKIRQENNILNRHFDCIHVANPKQNRVNRLKIANHLKRRNIDFELFEGGAQYGDIYIRILKDVQKKSYKRVLIFRDDIILHNHFEKRFSDFIGTVGDNWKVLQLGGFESDTDMFDMEDGGCFPLKSGDPTDSFAVALDLAAVNELIKTVAEGVSFGHIPLGEIYDKYPQKCFAAYPDMVILDKYQNIDSAKNYNLINFSYPLPKPSIAVLITSKTNLKYFPQFSSVKELPFNLRIYFNSSDGIRPLHNIDILDMPANKIVPIENESIILPRSDFAVTLSEDEILSESDLVKFIEYKTGIRKNNQTPLTELRAKHNRIIPGRVSVIIPTYKRPKNLKNALSSVVSQDYKDIEVIVVSDNEYGSDYERETEEIVNAFKDTNPNCEILLIKHSVNRNGAAARNTGILRSTGEFICFLDDDDIYLLGRLSKSIRALMVQEKTTGAIYCGYLGWNSPQNDTSRYKSGDLTLEILLLEYKKHYLHTDTATYRREAILNLNGFDESYRRHQDLELNLRFFEQYEMAVVREVLAHINPEPSPVDNKVLNMDILHLKSKFLRQFKPIIESFPLDIQRRVYALHHSEVLKHNIEKEKSIEYYKSQFHDFSAQILFELLQNSEDEIVRKNKHKNIGI